MGPSVYLPAVLGVLIGVAVAFGADGEEVRDPAGPGGVVDFGRDIEPVLQRHCRRCHGAERREGGLRLTSRKDLMQANESGLAAAIPGHSDRSEIIRRLLAEGDERMPAEGRPLDPDQIALIRRWIDQGADWPEGAQRRHWSYVAPVRPALPPVIDVGWTRHPIDRFVLAKLEGKGLAPSTPAEPARLVRRVFLDLVGLPPSIAEVDAYVQDGRPDAYERMVDRLLASPHYGERWASRWLDLARYADSNGYQADQFREIWPFRDWVIDALNADVGFDRFTIEQLAGDLIPNATLAQHVATGFHRCTTCNVEAGVDPEENRTNQIIDRINTTGTVWLGTTLECAQCHNHKYDPFTQKDYYQLFAYFNNTPLEVQLTGGVTFDFFGPKLELPMPADQETQRTGLLRRKAIVEANLRARLAELARIEPPAQRRATALVARRGPLASEDQESSSASPTTATSAGSAPAPGDAEPPRAIAAILALPDERRSERQWEQLGRFFEERDAETKRLRRERGELDKELAALDAPTSLVMVEMDQPRATQVFMRGNFLSPGAPVEPKTPDELVPALPGTPPSRLGLARWLVQSDQPLVGRVTANRWWGEFFGRGLVATLEDFGTQGRPPSHPDLLDWLAVELRESGWSAKRIHRSIVTSATYRQSSVVPGRLWELDPDNEWLARGPRFRLPAETIRDNALVASGLWGARMAGPPIYPPQPDGLWRHTGRNAPVYRTATGEDRFRRGVYVVWRRAAPFASFVNFDAPDRGSCCPDRPRTDTPLQALTLLNDPAFGEMALGLAARVLIEQPQATPSAQVEHAFRLCLARRPTDQELYHLEQLYRSELARFEADTKSARALVGSAPVVTRHLGIDASGPPGQTCRLAAWFFVANTLLNLDEMITKG